MYKTGIEVYNLGESSSHLAGFAFDRCGSDVCALASREGGIRELPIKKSLTLLNRREQGLKVQMTTWQDCLYQFNDYPEHADEVSQHDAVNGAVSHMYHTQMINYSKSK